MKLRDYDRFEDDFYFKCPRSWVSRRNFGRPGVTVANFDTVCGVWDQAGHRSVADAVRQPATRDAVARKLPSGLRLPFPKEGGGFLET